MPSQDAVHELQRLSAEKAVEMVSSGMIVGLGTGSTAKLAVDAIGRRPGAAAPHRRPAGHLLRAAAATVASQAEGHLIQVRACACALSQ